MRLFLSCHNDDEGLFGCFTILRLKPKVIVVTDGTTHQKRFGIPIETRREESRQACKLMGVRVSFLGIPDDEVTPNRLLTAFKKLKEERDYKAVYAPAIEGGNATHDMVSDAAWIVWKKRVVFYSTYSKLRLFPRGGHALMPTDYEREIKDRVLECYKSQIGLNAPHFEAVRNVPEFYE